MPNITPRFPLIAVLALGLTSGCGDDDDGGGQDSDLPASTTGSTGTTAMGSASTASTAETDPETEGPPTASSTTSSSETDGETDNSTGEPTDPELELWPAPYQEFIADVGGAKFIDLDGARMHYVETGPEDEPPVLLIHGIPTQAYLWRNVIAGLSGRHVVAIDLIGYGRSERPDIDYTPATQVEFLTEFVQSKGFDQVHLVVQDLGGPVGLRWAFENEDRVASITMFETLWAVLTDINSIPPPFGGDGGLLDQFRTPGVGEDLIGRQNAFFNSLSAFTVNGVTPEDQEVYEFGWESPEDRVRVILPSGPLAFPFEDEPAASAFVGAYEQFLIDSPIPKQAIGVSPGALTPVIVDTEDGPLNQVEYAGAFFANTEVHQLEGAGHFVQEDLPDELAQLIATFVDGLDE